MGYAGAEYSADGWLCTRCGGKLASMREKPRSERSLRRSPDARPTSKRGKLHSDSDCADVRLADMLEGVK